MKYSSRTMAGAAVSASMLTACTGLTSPEANPEIHLETAAQAASTEADISAEGYQQLMAADAPINIIHVPLHPEASLDQNDRLKNAVESASNFWSQSPADMAKSLIEFTDQATGGRYSPTRVVITEAAPLSKETTCIEDDDNNQASAMQRHVRPSLMPGAVNITAFDLPNCTDDFIAYGGVGTVPVMTTSSYPTFNANSLHEIGHSSGLAHSGTLECADPITITSCQHDPTADMGSVMSYQGLKTADDYSFADLVQLNILQPSEVTVPSLSGDYEVSDPVNGGDQQAPKGLVLPTEKGMLYVSWEEDDQAAFDQVCSGDTSTEAVAGTSSQSSSESSIGSAVMCTVSEARSNPRSLQVRLRGEDDYVSLVLRPESIQQEGSTYPLTKNGEVEPGALVYQDEYYTVSFVGQASDTTAVAHVEVNV